MQNPNVQYLWGWICPICGRVYAPWVRRCDACWSLKFVPASSATIVVNLGKPSKEFDHG